MKIYIMRHGKTVWNEKNITQGRAQNRLSKEGKAETQQAALQNINTQFDVIISSPLMRTMQTANIMNKYHNVEIIKDKDLTEIDQGVFTGRHINEYSAEDLKLKKARSKSVGMETYIECYNRLKNFAKKLKTYSYKSVLIVTHKCPAIYLEMALNNQPFKEPEYMDDVFKNSFKNSQIKMIEI